MNKALARLREYFFSDGDFDVFRASHDVRVFHAPDIDASRVDVFEKNGSRIRDSYAHNAEKTRRRKLPFMIEQLSNDVDGVQYIERLDESTGPEEPMYLARYLDATGCELRVSHGREWFLTEQIRAALRLALGRPFFPSSPGGPAFAPQTVHDGVVHLVFIEMAPRLTLAFATAR